MFHRLLDIKWVFAGIILVSLSLTILQIRLHKGEALLFQNEIDLIEQGQRMNGYPSKYFRLANIIEKRPESRLYFSLKNNFFTIFDLQSLPFVFIPLMVVGLFDLINNRYYKYLLFTLIIPVLILTYLGRDPVHGYFCLLPFLFISTINGFLSIIKKYLWSMTIMTSILVILNLFNGSKPYLSGFLLFDLIRGLSAIKKINVFDNSNQKYKISGWKWIFVFIGFFFLIAIGVGMGVAKSDTLLPDIKEIAVDKSENNSEIIDNMYRNTKYGFRIKFPEGWKMEVGDGKHIVQKASKGNASILITVQQLDLEGAQGIKDITEVFTIDEFIETSTQGAKDKFSDVKIIDKGETKIDNLPTYWFDYSATGETLGTKVNLTMRIFMFAKDDTIYSIQAGTSSDEYKATQSEFMKSVATFVLED